jgi:hypothetical protein
MMNKMAGGVGQISVALASGAYRAVLPFLSGVGVFSVLGFMVYLAVVLAVLVSWFLGKTRRGLNLRAVGENPATADAASIGVTAYKYAATCIGAAITGLGGLYYVMDYIKGHLGERRRHRKAGLAGRRAGHLRPLEARSGGLGLLPLRHAVLALFLHPRPHPLVPGDF